MKAYINEIFHFHPESILDNQLFSARLQTSDEWIQEHVGIVERRVLLQESENFPCFSLAKQCLQQALKKNPRLLADCDYIITCGSMDDLNYPTLGNLVCEAFELSKPTFHLKSACSSGLYAIELANALVKSGAVKNVLVIDSEAFTRQVDYGDRSSAILFGDGAAILTVSNAAKGAEILEIRTGSKGLPLVSSTRNSKTAHKTVFDFVNGKLPPGVPESNRRSRPEVQKFEQEGSKVKDFVLSSIPKIQMEFLRSCNLRANELDWIILHQANLRLMEAVCIALEVPKEKHLYNIDKFGNTSSSGVLTCASMHSKKLFSSGSVSLLSTFGAGMSWGNLLLKGVAV